MKFRDDIDIANTWIVSDTHFGHENIVGFCFRPEDHEQVMIAEWRATVPDNATVLHLGDLCYRGNARFKHITAKELTGDRKLLILGNHDRQRMSFYRDCGFKIVRPFAIEYPLPPLELTGPCPACNGGAWFDVADGCGMCGETREVTSALKQEPVTVSFSHYAWNEDEEGPMPSNALRIHGHIHNSGYSRGPFTPFLLNHINVSVEQTKYRPVNLKVLLDAALLGKYEETTEAQLEEARARREANRSA